MTFASLAKVIPLASLLVLGAWAQTTDMAKCISGFEWNRNSLGEDACTVGAKLDAACRGPVSYGYLPLDPNQYYLPPRKDHPEELFCDCNTVMYNFHMACASCQGALINSWPTWIAACETVRVVQFPITIPQGTAVPRWAYFDVTSVIGQTYDGATMMNIGRDPEVEPTPITTATSFTGGPEPTSTSDTSTKDGPNVGAVTGGVLGTVVTIVGVVFFVIRKTGVMDMMPSILSMFRPNADVQDKPQVSSTDRPPSANSDSSTRKPSDPPDEGPQSLPSSEKRNTTYSSHGIHTEDSPV